MSSDYGDDSGEKMLDSTARIGERWGESALRRRAWNLQNACDRASDKAEATAEAPDPGGDDPAPAWATLSMDDFQQAGDWEGAKRQIEEALRDNAVVPVWAEDPQTHLTDLLYRIEDAPQVSGAFDELGERIGREAAHPADERPLDERARQARQASAAIEAQREASRERELGEITREVGAR
ncbi:MAG: hypothetical protein ACOYIP_08770 [Coriobacteriales bacterium]|jgi:hypothetical protein